MWTAYSAAERGTANWRERLHAAQGICARLGERLYAERIEAALAALPTA